MTIEQRIEALERRCKRLGKTLVGVGTLALFAVVAGTAGWTVAYTRAISPSSITTETIVLKDSAGEQRLRLEGEDGSIIVYDKAGKKRLRLAGAYGEVKAYDSAGKTRLRLRGQDGTVRAYDSAGEQRVRLYGGKGRIEAYDSAGKWRIMLYGETGKVSFKTLNARGKISHP